MLRLAIFDLDGTLKQIRDPFIYLHKQLGVWEAAQAFSVKGLAGELEHEEWLRLDAAMWKGIERTTIESLLRQNPYLPGARETVTALKQAGVWVALVSTGLCLHAQQVQTDLGVDRIFANQLLFQDGVASGQFRHHVAEGGKGPIVTRLQREYGVGSDECLAVGDGTSDIDMFDRARVGVAVNPSSQLVRDASDLVLDTPDLGPLLPRLRAMAPGWIPKTDPC